MGSSEATDMGRAPAELRPRGCAGLVRVGQSGTEGGAMSKTSRTDRNGQRIDRPSLPPGTRTLPELPSLETPLYVIERKDDPPPKALSLLCDNARRGKKLASKRPGS